MNFHIKMTDKISNVLNASNTIEVLTPTVTNNLVFRTVYNAESYIDKCNEIIGIIANETILSADDRSKLIEYIKNDVITNFDKICKTDLISQIKDVNVSEKDLTIESENQVEPITREAAQESIKAKESVDSAVDLINQCVNELPEEKKKSCISAMLILEDYVIEILTKAKNKVESEKRYGVAFKLVRELLENPELKPYIDKLIINNPEFSKITGEALTVALINKYRPTGVITELIKVAEENKEIIKSKS